MGSDDAWHRYLVITREGSAEEVVAQGFALSFDHEAQAAVLKLQPDSSYKAVGRTGWFLEPQGIHMIAADVDPPEGMEEEGEDAD